MRRAEYIFSPESLTVFCIISNNILAKWDTDITRNLEIGQEYHLKEELYITPYFPTTIDLIRF
jgi:hypothetical protein